MSAPPLPYPVTLSLSHFFLHFLGCQTEDSVLVFVFFFFEQSVSLIVDCRSMWSSEDVNGVHVTSYRLSHPGGGFDSPW